MKSDLRHHSMLLAPIPFVHAMLTLPLVAFSAFLAFAGTSLSSPLSSNVLTLPSFNQSKVLTLPSFNQSDLSALNASAFNLSEGTFHRFPVPGTPVTLDVYSYDEHPIPRARLYAALSQAALLIQEVVDVYPTRQITSGLWRHQYRFKDGASCTFSVNDFSETGKPLTYSRLLDILQGLISVTYQLDLYTTLFYVADIKNVGVSATGRLEYPNPPETVASVDVT